MPPLRGAPPLGIPRMNGIEIIFLTEKNVAAAHKVEKSSLEAPWSESELALLIGDKDKFYYTAMIGGCVVGIAGFYSVIDECMIMNVAVDAAYRRKGIGDMLLSRLLADAAEHGCTFATLETAENNTAAIALYEKHGFTQNGRRKGYYHGADALLFRKDLD